MPEPELPDETQVTLAGMVRPTPLLDRVDLAGQSARRKQLEGMKDGDLSKKASIL